MMMTGDELYHRMFTKESTTSHAAPTKVEVLDVLRAWATWSQQYGPLIDNDQTFIEITEKTIDLISRQDLRRTRNPDLT